ncbi:topology modulation protein [Salipaludibacillus daqingensis]|uniref:topology modulation protein n=1 Tax=Salipaludibacillus daqingensis TaxID=3041001 RepID=UPI0024760804|nr:topology modulation protein [Salipaludibacillus daqingensis]
MERVMVVGVSAGVGKSTFAKRLSKKLSIPVYHLDRYYWEPGWRETSYETFCNKQEALVKKNKWIIEGNYGSTFDLRAQEADTIIYLELPLRICLYRVLKRWIMNIGNNRDDMGQGCPEKMDWEFLKFIITTFHQRKQKMSDRLIAFEKSGADKNTYKLINNKEISDFLNKD